MIVKSSIYTSFIGGKVELIILLILEIPILGAECGMFKTAVLLALCVLIIKGYYISKNKKIDTTNETIVKSNKTIQVQEQAVLNDLQQVQTVYRERVGYWYPDNYCSVEAVEFFYNVIQNYRADNLKEAINLYETTLHQRRVEDNQKQAVRQQKLNNLLSVGSLVMQGAALGEMKQQNIRQNFAMQDVNRSLDDIRSRLH